MDYWKQTIPLAELAAVQALLLCRTGDITVVVDNASVVKGINRGPHYKHRHNQHSWDVFRHLVGDRRITAVKVKSHLTEEEATAAGVELQHWAANQEADALAEEAARRAQLDPEAVVAVRAEDAKARRVQEHLLAVGLAVARDAPRLYGPSNRLARARRTPESAHARERRGRSPS